jgi:ATP:cob(I)alamin adenosyltransferase
MNKEAEMKSHLYTKLLGNIEVLKNDPRVILLGEIDEASAALGLARVYNNDPILGRSIKSIQKNLSILGTEIATINPNPHLPSISKKDLNNLESKVRYWKRKVGKVHKFIIPGNSTVSAYLHMARVIIRRAERTAVDLVVKNKLSSSVARYLNSLSNLIFYLSVYEEKSNKME